MCLDQLQIDGKHALLLNRDDQAGFRLDSTFTHKSTPSLNVDGPTLTIHTDFLNKHQKNPAQHASDLDIIQNIYINIYSFFDAVEKKIVLILYVKQTIFATKIHLVYIARRLRI